MTEYDLVIRGGTVVDGTGSPAYRADLAVRNGRVAKVSGKISPGGAKEIDASGCIVAPGAIDLHTHYDAQIQWDPYASLSGWFGVTSLTIGECGFGFAPTRPEDRDLNMRMMDRIEAIPLESMRKGMRWDWETFPQYLDSLDRQGLGVNVGAMVPFSPLRGYVLGMYPARERTTVTDAELNQMKEIFYEGMKAGGFGFSLDMNMEDRTEDGGLLPSAVASDREFHALAEVMGEFGVGHMGATLGFGLTPEQRKATRELVAQTMRLSGRPFHLLDLQQGEDPAWEQMCRAEKLPLVYQKPSTVNGAEFKLSEYNMFDYMPNWVDPLLGSPEERAAKLRQPSVREVMKTDVDNWPNKRTNWSRLRVLQVAHERNYEYEGMTIEELAGRTGKHPLDAFFDLALDEDLETEFEVPANDDPAELEARVPELLDPHSHISVSDGGAHTRFLTMSTWPVEWLTFWVRDRQIMTLEQAHYKMSAYPAWFTDFKDRGTLRLGSWADIIVYNLDELGYLYDKPIYANDFPGGERRLIQKPTGLHYTIVNGTVTFEGNNPTGSLPGKLLRSNEMVS